MLEFDKLKLKIEVIQKDIEASNLKVSNLSTSVKIKNEVRNFLISFSEYSRSIIKEKIETLVNSALKCVFIGKTLNFKLIPNKTKKGLQYDLYIETGGILTELTNAKGGGVLDIITLALRISFTRLFVSNLRQTIILDEPFKNLDFLRIEPAIEWLKKVSKEFKLQFIIVTHIRELIKKADKAYEFVLDPNEEIDTTNVLGSK